MVSLTTQRRAFQGSAAKVPQRPLQLNKRGILGLRLAEAFDDIIQMYAKCKLSFEEAPRFQKVTKAKQCMVGWDSLQEDLTGPWEKLGKGILN